MSSTDEPSRSHSCDVRTDSACTGSCRPNASRPSVTIETAEDTELTGPDDGLHLGVRRQAEHAAVAADAAVLHAPERCVVVALRRVDTDVARPQTFAHAERAVGVGAEDVVVQTEVGGVGDRD